MSTSGDFVFQGDAETAEQGMEFLFNYAYDFAVRLADNTVISINSAGFSDFLLEDLNPYAEIPGVYLTLIQSFATPDGPAVATLTVAYPELGGGFVLYNIPEPTTGMLLGVMTAGLLLRRRRQKAAT